jgi:LPXTG-motif cell wall-anchored protein
VVPAETVEPTAGEMETIPLVAVTPEAKEVPLAEAIQTAPSQEVAQLPKTASVTPLIALLGLLSISLGAGLKLFARRAF